MILPNTSHPRLPGFGSISRETVRTLLLDIFVYNDFMCELVFIYLHIKVLIFLFFSFERGSLFISLSSPSVALFFWPLNGQRRIRGPSGLTFFIVERHKQ